MTFTIEFGTPSSKTGRLTLSDKSIVVGRSTSCDVVLDNPYLSNRHLELWIDREGCAFVKDLNSSNGTTHNGEIITSEEAVSLSDGDRLDLSDGRGFIRIIQPEGHRINSIGLPPRGTVTFMFTDMIGSTDIVRDLGDIRSRELFRSHENILSTSIEANQGFIVKGQGDGFMASFSSCRSAIISGMDIQRSLLGLRELDGDIRINVRIGINTGEAVIENNDYYGRAVNEAARISAKADSEEILVSSVSKRMADSAGDIVFQDAREIELKGLPGTHLVYPVQWRDH